ncbi:alpha/beta fold hydrolase [Kribbella sp. NPDC058245]|uniref:alpha/beta fold hydrolase n=1 Tax=Kribbella sp. NPDC058245 TaxID=3346399 RepID=UPI0036EC2D9F
MGALSALVGAPVDRGGVDRGGRRLSWVAGGSGPTVIFEAGAASPVIGFAAVFKALAADHRVIAYDRAGYGASEVAPLSLEGQLDDLIAVLESAGSGVLVGHSWGGLLVQLATWARPDLVDGLVLLDPSHERFWSAPPVLPTDDVRREEQLESAREQAATTARVAGTTPEIEQLLEAACLSYLETPEQMAVHLAELPMILDHLPELAKRRTEAVWPQLPVVVLTAMKDRPEAFVRPVLDLHGAVAGATNARHTVVPDSGHYLHLDRPDLVTEAIREVTGVPFQAVGGV